MLRQIRIGLVGTSWWTDAMHMPALAKNTPVEPSFRDGTRIQPYLEAALLSARERRWVEVDEIQPEE